MASELLSLFNGNESAFRESTVVARRQQQVAGVHKHPARQQR